MGGLSASQPADAAVRAVVESETIKKAVSERLGVPVVSLEVQTYQVQLVPMVSPATSHAAILSTLSPSQHMLNACTHLTNYRRALA